MTFKNNHILLILFLIFIVQHEIKKTGDLNEHLTNDIDNIGVDIRNVKTLTFFKNKFTTANRSKPIKQLNCVGGNACNYENEINSVQCTNVGTNDTNDVQWKCETNLPSNLSFGKTNVNCEGLKNNNDKIKLKNSCGLEYTLNHSSDNNYNYYTTITIVSILFVLIIVFSVMLVLPNGFRSSGYYYNPFYLSPYYGPGYIPFNNLFNSNYNSFPSRSSNYGYGTTTTR